MTTVNIPISTETLLAKREACIKALNPAKSCETCAYHSNSSYNKPCDNCYDELLGFPVDPTQWKKAQPHRGTAINCWSLPGENANLTPDKDKDKSGKQFC